MQDSTVKHLRRQSFEVPTKKLLFTLLQEMRFGVLLSVYHFGRKQK